MRANSGMRSRQCMKCKEYATLQAAAKKQPASTPCTLFVLRPASPGRCTTRDPHSTAWLAPCSPSIYQAPGGSLPPSADAQSRPGPRVEHSFGLNSILDQPRLYYAGRFGMWTHFHSIYLLLLLSDTIHFCVSIACCFMFAYSL